MNKHLEDVFEGLPPLLDAPAVADLLAMSTQGVYKWLRDGKLPGYKLNGNWVIIRDELKAQIAAGYNQPTDSQE